ncbi:MAG: glycoside hydrolase family 25 protein [Pseudobutyrivibrio sp.]|nr:glycoside hydrolase family 25 protein [Pseudobutyrivibrio sp.]
MRKTIRYIIISIISVVLTLLVVGIISINIFSNQKAEELAIDPDVTYTAEEAEELIEDAKQEGRISVLNDIRLSLEKGDTVISILKSLYPEYIVVAANSKYNFVPIESSLAKNNYEIDNLTEDTENGRLFYQEDGQVVSHFGIDVSSHQGDIDWAKVKEDGVEFAIIRAVYRGYGTGKLVVDEYCTKNIEGAKAAGIKVGVYVFSQAINQDEVKEEAATVENLISGYDIDLPVVFDVEKVNDSQGRANKLSVDERTDLTIAFLEDMESKGYDTMIYHNTEMGAMLLDLNRLTDYKKWFAGYNKEFYWPYQFDLWQYSETGQVSGVNSNVDLDIWLGDFPY